MEEHDREVAMMAVNGRVFMMGCSWQVVNNELVMVCGYDWVVKLE